ncbi:MFS general substrate transporter [Setomelanomma holmii]|uniref:MFS general substrate transporter n=1 Tax=Setomelanomma holmii TaxID=210430 RepID=A0A9P4LEL6_9PLEO|nr:MFS general substrate transporter [Setomelanomma holmii]
MAPKSALLISGDANSHKYTPERALTIDRGALVMNWQLFDVFGIFLGFTANLIVSQTGDNRWRYEVASAVIPTMVLLSLVWTIPESPRWLLKKGRYQDAFASFCALRETPLQAAAELYYANAQIQAEIKLLGRKARELDTEASRNHDDQSNGHSTGASIQKREMEYIRHNENADGDITEPTAQPDKEAAANQKASVNACLPLHQRIKRAWDIIMNEKDDYDLEEYQRCAKASFYVTRVWQLFSMPRIRRATTAALVMMCTQQMCGILQGLRLTNESAQNILQFYSTTFFHDPKLTSNSLLGPGLSLGFGLANFIFTFPIYGFIDRRGRRFLLLSSYPGMIVSMFGACLSYNINNETRRLAVVVMFMFFFVFFYSWGQGPVPFAYSSEVFPLLNREAGMSFAVFANLFGAGILALVVPQLTRALASYPPHDVDLKTGESRLLGIFTGLNVLSLILIFFFVPETAGATLGSDDDQGLNYISLEELNYIFNVKTTKHIIYQVTVMVPWAWRMMQWRWRRWVQGRELPRPDDPYQLYTWVQAEQVNDLGQEIIERRRSHEGTGSG